MSDLSASGADPASAPPAPCDILVSIINYRTADMTIACVESVLADIAGPEARAVGLDVHVVVVDNRSNDGSDDAIEAWIAAQTPPPPVTLKRSATNAGYSGGHNQGMGAREATAYLILNSDALLRPGALATLWAALDADPARGLIAPQLEWPDGAPQISCFRFASPISELIRGASFSALTRALKRWDTPLPPPPDAAAIGWVSFACVLVRADMRAQIGPMDEGYFMYFEDADYCWRARAAGWRVVYEPAARVVHLRGGSAPVKKLAAAKKRLPAYFYASRTRFLTRAYGWTGLAAANLLWLIGRAASWLKLLAGKRPSRVSREALDMWINFLRPMGDRRAPGS